MQLNQKSDSPVDSLTNDSTPSPSDFTVLDSPSTSEVPDVCKKKQQGFPLVGCLTTFLVLGMLGALTLRNLTSCTNKAKQSEPKQNVGALNRAQQAYFLENGKFSDSLSELGVGIKTETENYSYRIISPPKNRLFQKLHGTVFPPSLKDAAIIIAQSKNPKNKSYVGINWTIPGDVSTSEVLSIGIVCESEKPTTTISTVPTFQKDERGNQYLGCPEGYKGGKRP
jgi:type IV pilus assembly protein PilA